jgi:hypothetical protein
MYHVSQQVKFTITCGSGYVVSESSFPAGYSNPQVVTHLASTNTIGFNLPTYTSAQNQGCPIDTWEITTSNSGPVLAPAGLNQVSDNGSGGKWVQPTNWNTHAQYTFYVKATASNGGSTGYFGPYYLDVGCNFRTAQFTTSVVYADSGSLTTNVNLYVGDSVANVYTLVEPTSTLAWCTTKTNTIVNTDGTSWSGSAMVGSTTGCSAQPPSCTVFSLVSTTYHLIVPFKILTTFDNLSHLSQQLTFTITCASTYSVTETAYPPGYATT